MFEGTNTALITPFRDDRIDLDSLRALVERQIENGIHGLVVCGTTGEAAAMSMEERLLVIRHVVEQAKGRVPVVAGTGTNNHRDSIEMTRKAAALKVDGVLVVTPYYVKPTQHGLVEHFQKVAEVGPPVVAYNVPGRTGVSLTPDSVKALAAIDNVVALKEATGDLKLDGMMVRAAGDRLTLLSGDDFTYLPLLSVGGKGCISVLSNLAPREMADLSNLWRQGDSAGARDLHLRLLPLMDAMFTESNPIPVKASLAMLGLCSWEIRLPMTPLSESLRPGLKQIMTESGIAGVDS